jgi:hypothetical protein
VLGAAAAPGIQNMSGEAAAAAAAAAASACSSPVGRTTDHLRSEVQVGGRLWSYWSGHATVATTPREDTWNVCYCEFILCFFLLFVIVYSPYVYSSSYLCYKNTMNYFMGGKQEGNFLPKKTRHTLANILQLIIFIITKEWALNNWLSLSLFNLPSSCCYQRSETELSNPLIERAGLGTWSVIPDEVEYRDNKSVCQYAYKS